MSSTTKRHIMSFVIAPTLAHPFCEEVARAFLVDKDNIISVVSMLVFMKV